MERRREVSGGTKEGRSFLPSPRRQLEMSDLQHGLDRSWTWLMTVTQNISLGYCFLCHQHRTAFSELATSRRRYMKTNSHSVGFPNSLTNAGASAGMKEGDIAPNSETRDSLALML